MKNIKLYICIIVILFISSCNRTTIRQHKDFAQIFPKYNSVAIMATDMLITIKTKDGNKVTQVSPARVNNVTGMASTELAKKGYNVKDLIGAAEQESYGAEFSKAYNKSINDLYANPEMAKKENALAIDSSLGPNVKAITKSSKADLLLVMAYTGNEMSQEQITKNFAKDIAWSAVGVENETHVKEGSAIISLIDGHNGNILWTNIGTDFENYGASVARLITGQNVFENSFTKALKTLPDKNNGS